MVNEGVVSTVFDVKVVVGLPMTPSHLLMLSEVCSRMLGPFGKELLVVLLGLVANVGLDWEDP